MRLHNKVAVVTGGGSGIGKATAVLFGQEGASIVVADIKGDAAEFTAKQIRDSGGTACSIAVDVTKAMDIKAMVQTAVKEYKELYMFSIPRC